MKLPVIPDVYALVLQRTELVEGKFWGCNQEKSLRAWVCGSLPWLGGANVPTHNGGESVVDLKQRTAGRVQLNLVLIQWVVGN